MGHFVKDRHPRPDDWDGHASTEGPSARGVLEDELLEETQLHGVDVDERAVQEVRAASAGMFTTVVYDGFPPSRRTAR